MQKTREILKHIDNIPTYIPALLWWLLSPIRYVFDKWGDAAEHHLNRASFSTFSGIFSLIAGMILVMALGFLLGIILIGLAFLLFPI
jgi:hypothetical protein